MKLLVLILSVALASSESLSYQEAEALIKEIFGNKTVKPSTESATSTTTGISSTSETSLASEDNAPCRCVPYYLCSEVIPSDSIDIHGGLDQCPDLFEYCCPIKAIASSK